MLIHRPWIEGKSRGNYNVQLRYAMFPKAKRGKEWCINVLNDRRTDVCKWEGNIPWKHLCCSRFIDRIDRSVKSVAAISQRVSPFSGHVTRDHLRKTGKIRGKKESRGSFKVPRVQWTELRSWMYNSKISGPTRVPQIYLQRPELVFPWKNQNENERVLLKRR